MPPTNSAQREPPDRARRQQRHRQHDARRRGRRTRSGARRNRAAGRPLRIATDGLEASDSTMPQPRPAPAARRRSTRSNDSHHWPSTLSSAREIRISRLRCVELDAGQRRHERTERVAADLEVLELVVGRAGRRQQHDGLGARRTRRHRGRRRRPPCRACRSARTSTLPCERRCEIVARFADQVGLGDAREQRLEAGDAAFLLLAAGDPEDVARPRWRAPSSVEVRVGRLAVVDEQRRGRCGRSPPSGGRDRGSCERRLQRLAAALDGGVGRHLLVARDAPCGRRSRRRSRTGGASGCRRA